jgi:HD superfamily phosphohydrolase YqeK
MKCPGQDTRYWSAEAVFEVACPRCGNAEEFFKDEPTRRCKKCGEKLVNPNMDFGCAAYCKFAKECLGDLPPELVTQRKNLLKDRVAIEMKACFQKDFKRIGHATKVARYAEKLVKEEKGDPAVVLSAAYLHDVGIKEAEWKYQSTATPYQEKKGFAIARAILANLGADAELIDEVCDIISHHNHPRAEETINFKVVFDADQIVNLEEKLEETPLPPDKVSEKINRTFLTKTGKQLAEKIFSKHEAI